MSQVALIAEVFNAKDLLLAAVSIVGQLRTAGHHPYYNLECEGKQLPSGMLVVSRQVRRTMR